MLILNISFYEISLSSTYFSLSLYHTKHIVIFYSAFAAQPYHMCIVLVRLYSAAIYVYYTNYIINAFFEHIRTIMVNRAIKHAPRAAAIILMCVCLSTHHQHHNHLRGREIARARIHRASARCVCRVCRVSVCEKTLVVILHAAQRPKEPHPHRR